MVTATGSIWSTLSPTQRSLVLALLRHGRMQRPELAARLGISNPSITRLTTPLIEAGLLTASTEQVAATGRPQNPLEVNADLETLIGIVLTGHTLTATLTTLHLDPLATTRRSLSSHEPDAVANLLADAIDELRTHAPQPPSCVGVSLGGSSLDGRVVDEAVFLGWHACPLAAMLEERTGLPTIIGNDLTALTQQEAWFGAGREHERFCLVTIGAGVGFGLVVGGQVISTADSEHGLMGMVPISDGGRPPRAVRAQECLTTLALEDGWRARTGQAGVAAEIEAAAAEGNADAVAACEDLALVLGHFVGVAAAFTLPDQVVIAGERSAIASLCEEALMEGIAQVRRAGAQPIDVTVREHDRVQWARGAASLALSARVAGRLEAC